MPSMEIQISVEAHVALKERAAKEGLNLRTLARNIVESALTTPAPQPEPQATLDGEVVEIEKRVAECSKRLHERNPEENTSRHDIPWLLDDAETLLRLLKAKPAAAWVDREALAEAVRPFVDQFDGNATSRKYLCADALIASGILHPMQTRDEIAITLIETRLWKGAWLSAGETERDIFYQQADAILALIEGAKP
ncbi:hypothetical protein UFOVP1169_46 [uncultured Caudovirales phage]|uniref:Uncharacterized protein n=1 Tax=uncultured Caudovirales phage TaxID=2100421 RepID=A0A6J5R028_9CAUD|nr:hypothetical protein UFOVP1169_46 [uncultured Caudovirales phage]